MVTETKFRYELTSNSLDLVDLLVTLLGCDNVIIGHHPGFCYADMTVDEADAITELARDQDPTVVVRFCGECLTHDHKSPQKSVLVW